jgi:rsbT co-antagonist protein RsbR
MSISTLATLLRSHEAALLSAWLSEQKSSGTIRNLMSDSQVRSQSNEFVQMLLQAVTEASTGSSTDVYGSAFRDLRGFLENITATRAELGFTPSETATFVFSFKQPLYRQIRQSITDPVQQVDEIWNATMLLDRLGLFVTEAHQKAREGVIRRQQEEMLELSTPVVKLWDGILALPIIGTLDSSRTQTIMESLLERIVATGSEIAIIDITGVPTVDTLTAQHLLKTVTAARLMGAECIISGIRPQIAQTIVHLGVELGDVITKASLADAFRIALQRSNLVVVKRQTPARV